MTAAIQTRRKVESVESLIGLKGATAVADVTGARVELLAINLGASEHADILGLVLPFMRRRIEEHLRDYTVVGQVFDWDVEA